MTMPSISTHPLVIVIEDEPFTAMDVCDTLDEAGLRVVGRLATTPTALACIERERPDLAILGLMLKDGPSTLLAAELRRRSVPFLVHSGHRPDMWLAEEFKGAPWLDKPARPQDIVAKLHELSQLAVGM